MQTQAPVLLEQVPRDEHVLADSHASPSKQGSQAQLPSALLQLPCIEHDCATVQRPLASRPQQGAQAQPEPGWHGPAAPGPQSMIESAHAGPVAHCAGSQTHVPSTPLQAPRGALQFFATEQAPVASFAQHASLQTQAPANSGAQTPPAPQSRCEVQRPPLRTPQASAHSQNPPGPPTGPGSPVTRQLFSTVTGSVSLRKHAGSGDSLQTGLVLPPSCATVRTYDHARQPGVAVQRSWHV